VEAAKHLIHCQGFGQTTLADIARESDVPLGNVYYYFKTKDDIATAVIADRMDEFCSHLRRCGHEKDPKCQLIAFAKSMAGMSDMLADKGCPVGSLVQELGKTPSRLSNMADDIVKRQLEWTKDRFAELGVSDPDRASARMVSVIQGACLTSHALKDPKVMRQQMADLEDWIKSL